MERRYSCCTCKSEISRFGRSAKMIFNLLAIAILGYYVECIDHDLSLNSNPILAHSPAFLNHLPRPIKNGLLPKSSKESRLAYLPDDLGHNSWENEVIPSLIYVGDHRYKISKFAGSGKEGKVFEGYDVSDPLRESVIIKMFHPKIKNMDLISFINEKRALWLQSRLIQSDRKSQILVSKKIEGRLLDECIVDLVMNHEFDKVANLLQDYLDLLPRFRQKYHLVHGDAHPKNIIVDRDGQMHLIDFGFTRRLSNDSRMAESQIEKDESVMMYWVRFYLKFLEDIIHRGGHD